MVAQVRTIVSAGAGVLRDADGLRTALAALEGLRHNDAGLVGHLLVEAALRREESRGGHTRLDFPATAEVGEHILTLLAHRHRLVRALGGDSEPQSPDRLGAAGAREGVAAR